LTAPAAAREGLRRRALELEYLTLGWNVIEGVVAAWAALAAGSIALLAFGLDSLIESVSAGILIWRLKAEREQPPEAIEALDRRAHRGVGLSLFVLAAYVAWEAGGALWERERPGVSAVGIAITAVSIAVMIVLARAKRRAAAGLGSRALAADAFQTTACWWLSIITLGGIGLNAALGWWWADPLAALAMVALLVREGREAWRGEDCGCATAAR
jgi:divalent metal cation (Fe/Co/Zn/Cd) transporter